MHLGCFYRHIKQNDFVDLVMINLEGIHILHARSAELQTNSSLSKASLNFIPYVSSGKMLIARDFHKVFTGSDLSAWLHLKWEPSSNALSSTFKQLQSIFKKRQGEKSQLSSTAVMRRWIL